MSYAVQVGFFEIVALPLFSAYTSMLPAAKPLLDAAMSNYHFWHSTAASAEARGHHPPSE